MNREPSLLVTLGIPALACATVAAIAFAIHALPEHGAKSSRRFLLGVTIWFAAASALAAFGVLRDAHALPPRMLLIFVPMVLLPVALAWSKLGTALALKLPLAWLVGIHAFRLPLELVMHQAAVEGTMPEQMTFTGLNFDILTGIAAIVVAVLASYGRASRALVFAFNVLGSALLVAIGTIAIASLPMFHAFGTEPARLNTWVADFPFVLLPAGLVSSGLFAHILLWRRLSHEAVSEPKALNCQGTSRSG
jgi:hypothetical protein